MARVLSPASSTALAVTTSPFGNNVNRSAPGTLAIAVAAVAPPSGTIQIVPCS